MVVPQYIDRRVDSLGRITLPVGLRKRMQIEEGMDLEVYTFVEKGREYIALAKPLPKESFSTGENAPAKKLKENRE